MTFRCMEKLDGQKPEGHRYVLQGQIPYDGWKRCALPDVVDQRKLKTADCDRIFLKEVFNKVFGI